MPILAISYRRSDSDAIAGRIRDRLANNYGEESVFMDIDNIPFGVDFREHIKSVLGQADVLLTIIGRNWIGAGKKQRRISQGTDLVRIEVETALSQGTPVIPVLVNGASIPKAADLPPSLRDICYINAADVESGRDFHRDVDRLIKSIDQKIEAKKTRSNNRSHGNKGAAPPQRTLLFGGLLGAFLLAGGAFVFYWISTRSPQIGSPKQAGEQLSEVSAGPAATETMSPKPAEISKSALDESLGADSPTLAPEGKYPWLVRLYSSLDDHVGFCGGSLISDRWVLAAAHCLIDTDQVVIGYGSIDRTKTKKIDSDKIIIHPDYLNGATADIALIKLKSPIPHATPIAVSDVETEDRLIKPGPMLTVAGWGALISDMEDKRVSQFANQFPASSEQIAEMIRFPVKLHEFNVDVFDRQNCKILYEAFDPPQTISDNEICAWKPDSKFDASFGDAGGPLMASTPHDYPQFAQIGIVSWGRPRMPGVYTRVSSFARWIKETMANN
jgi:hypothetical protein